MIDKEVLQKVCFRQPRKRAKNWIIVLRIQDRPQGNEQHLTGPEVLKEVKSGLGNMSAGLTIKSSSYYEMKNGRTHGRSKV